MPVVGSVGSGAARSDGSDHRHRMTFNFDFALRARSLGWFEPRNPVPIAIINIDKGTNRRWGTPAVMPRAQLEQSLRTVAAAQPLAVVIDIDLSWGERRPGRTQGSSNWQPSFRATPGSRRSCCQSASSRWQMACRHLPRAHTTASSR